jgi:PD-(D/E)XK nuclease superfamily
MNLIKAHNFPIDQLDHIEADTEELETFEIENVSLKTLLFQAGYLTIQDYNYETKNYLLSYPNQEVKSSFFKHVLRKLTTLALSKINVTIQQLVYSITNDDINLFLETMQVFFADIPCGIQVPQEKYYQTIFYVLAKLLGLIAQVEVMTNIGRIHLVIETCTHIHIFEFKINQQSIHALNQMEEKRYFEKYLDSRKKSL